MTNKERYRLINADGQRVMSSDDKQNIIDMKQNMLDSGRFVKKKVLGMVIVDLDSLPNIKGKQPA